MYPSLSWQTETLHHLSEEMARAIPEQLDFHWPEAEIRRIIAEQVVLVLPYRDFVGTEHRGQLVVHQALGDTVKEIFIALFDERFPIGGMAPVSAYAWDDDRSMIANNCVGFHFRKKTGKNKKPELSWHAYGRAIDINPLQNPYQKGRIVLPPGAIHEPERLGACGPDSLPVRLFKTHGFTWGGDWTSLKDYMHFELPDIP